MELLPSIPLISYKKHAKTTWSKGKMVVTNSNVKTLVERWKKFPYQEGGPYSYEHVRSLFPPSVHFRAGIVPIYNDKILMVKERQKLTQDKFGNIYLNDGFYGPVKGSEEPEDKFVIQTASRELKEELGVVLDATEDFLFMVVLPRLHISEVFIYFVIRFNTEPVITMNESELDGYEWMTIGQIMELPNGKMSTPTKCLMKHLSTARGVFSQ